MDPFSWVMTAVSVAKTGVDMIGGSQQAGADAQIAGYNADISRRNAKQSRLEADQSEAAQRREARETLGNAAAAMAQSGTGTGGTNADLLTQNVRKAELDALNIRYGGETQANAYEVQASQFDAEKAAAKKRQKWAVIGGVVGMGASALKGRADYKNANPGLSRTDPNISGLTKMEQARRRAGVPAAGFY